jgi:tRNA threonylcarbamoyladenosine biosynthesis protein TsaB
MNSLQRTRKNVAILSKQMTQKPLILAVETSGRTGSVAIALGEQILGEVAFSGPMRHSAELFPAVCSLLDGLNRKPEDIEHIYISAGPGSFTGLRIAVTMAKTMHLANALKIVAVNTLDIIAANVISLTPESTQKKINQEPNSEVKKTSLEKIAAILDAKRGQFFIAAYQNKQGRWTKSLPDCLMTTTQFLEQFANKTEPIWLLGEGLVYHKDKFKANGVKFLDERYWSPQAEKVHLLGYEMALAGQFAEALTLKPEYLTVLWL